MSSQSPEEIEAVTDHDGPIVPERFRVHDDATANWLVRRIVETRNYRHAAKTWGQQEVRRADRDEAFFMSRYGPELDAWLRLQLNERRSHRRSITLPAGTVGLRRQPQKFVVINEDAVIAWARRACPQAVETVTTVRLKKRTVVEHITRTGEMPPAAAELQNGAIRLYIR